MFRGGRRRTARGLIRVMSFQLAIPWRVALPQSPPPLHQPARILQDSAFAVQFNSRTANSILICIFTVNVSNSIFSVDFILSPVVCDL